MLLVDNEFLPQALAFIGTAERRIDIATFKAEITSKPRGQRLRLFFEELYKKREQGLEINFLLNWHYERRIMPLSNITAVRELKQRKINVRILDHNRCCHAKILIVDRQKAIVGSHNLSVRSCHNNFEVSYIIQDPLHVACLSSVYEKVFLGAKTP